MAEIRKTCSGIASVYQREIGHLSSTKFKNRLAASEDLVLRFGIQRKLIQHSGCVNTVTFNDDGDILISGSDDRMVILWDWDVGKIKFSFDSGHSNSVFQAQFMPFSNNKSIVTSSADGEVRHAMICEGGKVANIKLSQHAGLVHKLALEPGSPYVFYSSGEDATVQRFDLRTKAGTLLFVCRDAESTYVHLNDISIDPRNPNYFAIGGSDRYARLYDIRRYGSNTDAIGESGQPCDFFCPPELVNQEARITGLRFSNKSELLVSYRDRNIHLFLKDQGLGTEPLQLQSIDDEDCPMIYEGHQNCCMVKGGNFYGPNCDYVVGGSECGRIYVWRKKDGELLRVMEGDKYRVNCIEPHPYSPSIASSGIEKDIKIWTPNSSEQASPVDLDKILKACRVCRPYFFGLEVAVDDDDDGDDIYSEGFVDGDDNDNDDDGDGDIDDLDVGDDIDVLDVDEDGGIDFDNDIDNLNDDDFNVIDDNDVDNDYGIDDLDDDLNDEGFVLF